MSEHAHHPGRSRAGWTRLREYFLSVVWEAAHRSQQTVPNLNDYTLMRIYDGATSVVLPLLEMGHGYELHPSERDHPSVRAAAEMAYFVITWDNDLFSYHKESRAGRLLPQRPARPRTRVPPRPRRGADASPSPSATASWSCSSGCAITCAGHRKPATAAIPAQPGGDFIRGSAGLGHQLPPLHHPRRPGRLPSTFPRPRPTTAREPLDIPCVAWWWGLLSPRPSAQA